MNRRSSSSTVSKPAAAGMEVVWHPDARLVIGEADLADDGVAAEVARVVAARA